MSLVALTGNQDIDGVLWGVKWDLTTLTYGFATATTDYLGYPLFAFQGFTEFNAIQQAKVADIITMLNGLIAEPVVATSDPTAANLRFSEADYVNQDGLGNPGSIPTAVGTPPEPIQFPTYSHGDMFFNTSDYNAPEKGNYAYLTMIHELGHALGLKHGHVTQNYPGSSLVIPALPTNHDSMEFSVMTYRSEVGGITAHYTNEPFGYAQTYMMDDIAALQYLYGADYGFNSGDTTYKWSPKTGEMFIDGVGQGAPGADRIFLTIWDGGGTDTYDFSNYHTNLKVSLAPGKWSITSHKQLAILDVDTNHRARGSIFNALLHNNDHRSLIENAKGGSGDDKIVGNIANNHLNGGAGNDKLFGKSGGDTLIGGTDNDTLTGGNGNDHLLGGKGNDVLNADNGNDLLIAGSGADHLVGSKGADSLIGGGGADTLLGGDGSDTLYGGKGRDVMNGQRGHDTFVFKTVKDSTPDSHRDVIQNFAVGKDILDLSAIDAKTGVAGNQAFHYIGSHDFSNSKGELHALHFGNNIRVEGDINGDGHADFSILLQNVASLTAHDFIL